MNKWISGVLLFAAQALFSASAFAADPIYTGFFSNKALDGYDTVAYFTQGKAVEGSKKFKLSYKGADWYFSSQENLDKFQADPDKFAPQYGGYCAWAIAAKSDFAPGDPQQWSIVDDKLYLNYDKSIKDMWLEDVPGFISQGDKNWPSLIN